MLRSHVTRSGWLYTGTYARYDCSAVQNTNSQQCVCFALIRMSLMRPNCDEQAV